MNDILKFPEAARFEKIVAKSKIYEHGSSSSKIKELFVDQIEKIIWSYKLSPDTINLPASDGVQEIQVFTLILRTQELSQLVLQAIDKAIPSPIFFELKYCGQTKYVVSYKRAAETDTKKWVISSYIQSDWLQDNNSATELPRALNMSALYRSLLAMFSPLRFRKGENLNELIERVDLLRRKEREAMKLESRIKKEKQFNRRVELNQDMNALKKDIEELVR